MTEINQSQSFNTLDDWLSYLERIHPNEIELGLSRVKHTASTCDLLTIPSKIILIAGTNGKGTTARCLESILLAHGYTVGVFSSPHIHTYNERVRINGEMLPDNEHISAFQGIEDKRGETSLTYFEFGALAALWLFKKHEVDFILLEVGLGGRLDATNIVEPDASVITTIGLDHTDWLGDDIEQIGYEKAGVFRANKPAIVGALAAPKSIVNYGNDINAQLIEVERDYSFKLTSSENWQYNYHLQDDTNASVEFLSLPMPNIPIQNAATAITTLLSLNLTLNEQKLIESISSLTVEGRMQPLLKQPAFYVDVAHNPQSAEYLATQLDKMRANKGKIIAVVAMLKDKDIESTLACLLNVIDEWIVAPLSVPRGEKQTRLFEYLSENTDTNIQQTANLKESCELALQTANKNDLIIGFGSFFTVAEIMSELENRDI
ncbi:bifunctional tetrahydrofolate synthase/dihydrofolate synthase [Flocculibacter collagenilyticus]|uniref:bifunctional tetrahydrofolate synthase/dihydrofolate synthase n=1 Tax=Flocculibacter collagenilyticus TaxID=2744479 RepID=UPI0018F59078|nr:bifunctional tetrahydrofolate synthase/dihydrofolate synthase [Flocculibacter collagenilyticus]